MKRHIRIHRPAAWRLVTLLLAALLISGTLLAQDTDCLAVFREAVETAHIVCAEVGENQVCYGSGSVEIQPRANVRVVFAEPGDQVDLAAVESLALSPDDGLVVLNVRGNFPNRSVRMVAFGDMLVENESEAASDFAVLSVTVNHPQGANVRETLSQDAALVRSLNNGETLLAIGRLNDNSWIRLLDGWIAADLVRALDDLNVLRALSPDDPIDDEFYGPMQAFSFQTRTTNAPCTLGGGLLVQATGQNASLRINGVDIGFTDTIWLQTDDEDATVLSVLSGTANYTEMLWNTGETVRFGSEEATMFFAAPVDYNYALARSLPFALLPRQIELPFSTGGLITPFEPGTGFLNTIPADGACTVAWTTDVNLRGGPGTNYPIRQGIAGGYYALPDARAVGSDGRLWWRLADAVWLAADNTAAAGACGTLPLEDAPPLPTETPN